MTNNEKAPLDPNELMPCGQMTRLDYQAIKRANPFWAARYAETYRLYESGFRDLSPDNTSDGRARMATLRAPEPPTGTPTKE